MGRYKLCKVSVSRGVGVEPPTQQKHQSERQRSIRASRHAESWRRAFVMAMSCHKTVLKHYIYNELNYLNMIKPLNKIENKSN